MAAFAGISKVAVRDLNATHDTAGPAPGVQP